MVSTVAEFVAAMADLTQPDGAATWDPVGLQIGDPRSQAARVAVCHEVTEEVVAAIEEDPVDLLVTYHPLLFHPTNRLVAGRSAEARAFRLIRSGVALLVAHTDFDAAPGGAADAMASMLGLGDVRPFGADADRGAPAIGRYGSFGFELGVIAARVSDLVTSTGLRIHGSRDTPIESVAVVPGSGADFIEVATEVAQALVTGDVPHHRAVRALDLGLSIVDPGHTATERPGMEALVGMVESVAGGEVVDLTGIDPRTWA